jgi:hypothetical protein
MPKPRDVLIPIFARLKRARVFTLPGRLVSRTPHCQCGGAGAIPAWGAIAKEAPCPPG